MSLQAQMDADMDRVFLRTADHAVAVTYLPDGAGPGFAAKAVIGPVPQVFSTDSSGIDEQRKADFAMSLSVLAAGILAQLTTARLPRRNDTIVVGAAPAAYTGTWTVQSVQPDNGGAVTLTCQLAVVHLDAGETAQRTDP